MLDSVVLDVAIGLSLLLFVLALAASAIVELISQVLSKRATDLHRVLDAMIGDPDLADSGLRALYATAVFRSLAAASGGRPSYVSARTFADGVIEVIAQTRRVSADGAELAGKLPPGLAARLEPMVSQIGNDLTELKSEIEQWFDESMDRLQGTYKRWAGTALLGTGLVLSAGANASVYTVIDAMWADAAVRDAVVASAGAVTTDGGVGADIDTVAETVETLEQLQVPVGWAGVADWDAPRWAGVIGGWLLTGVLVMAGAPFWFDLLTKLVSLRSTGRRPPTALDDPKSATHVVVEADPAARPMAGAQSALPGRFWGDVLYHLVR